MASVPVGTYEVDPISRIEGHLGVKVSVAADGKIDEAWAHANLWRGFENFLIGRQTNDAITFTQRICGVCPIPHATASTFATEAALGVSDGYITFATGVSSAGKGVPAKAVLVRNLTYAAEFLMSHITHFYHLAAPSYVQGPNMAPWTPYFADGDYSDYLKSEDRALPEEGDVSGGTAWSKDLWSAVITQYVKALRVRRLTFDAGAMFAGRMPMVSTYVAGGVTNQTGDAKHVDKCKAFKQATAEVGRFILKEYVPVTMALGALYPEFDNTNNDYTPTLPSAGLGYGEGCKNMLAWGAFPGGATGAGSTLAINGGYSINGGAVQNLLTNASQLSTAKAAVAANLLESISRSRYANTFGYSEGVDTAYPGNVSRTEPKRDDEDKYSWMKAPRWDGNPMEVGPLARMIVNNLYGDGDAILAKLGVDGLYTKDIGGNVGVDPAMIAPDLAVALVRARFAKLEVDPAGTPLVVDDTVLPTLTEAQIAAAYTGGNSIIIDGDDVPLVTYLTTVQGGYSTIDRLRARALEAAYLVQQMIGAYDKDDDTFGGAADDAFSSNADWISSLSALGAVTGYRSVAVPAGTVSGMGVSEAPRGALAHFCTSTNGKIARYQCVVPTTWNGSPKDGADGVGTRGPIEEAMIGVPYADGTTDNGRLSGVEVLRVAQSFDPCIACAVH